MQIVHDRVQETGTATTGNITLSGAVEYLIRCLILATNSYSQIIIGTFNTYNLGATTGTTVTVGSTNL